MVAAGKPFELYEYADGLLKAWWQWKYTVLCVRITTRRYLRPMACKGEEVTHRAENIPREYLRRIWVLLRVVFGRTLRRVRRRFDRSVAAKRRTERP